ncbi:MAG TPA: hypothetical protein VFO75_00870 [Candidatus Dormibacteraeota bacterium]|nr:hypothetical protein [Candidatus Dormibacteraeota bacterium]
MSSRGPLLHPRALGGVIAGGVAGALVFAGFIVLGLVLDDRVTSIAPVIILGLAGAYAGWLLGVVVFGAVRGGSDAQVDEEESP